ncbi:MAG TPA: YdiU family protein [Kofleriaceae bacterium]
MATVDQLQFQDAFVRTLPGDKRADNRVRQVHEACYSRVEPTPVPAPELLVLVPEVAELLGLEESPELVQVLAGNRVVTGMAPYAACYGGHQFGTWAGQLGDGRAITLGEVTHANETWELQLKGAGPTPYSRTADGRAVLRSSLRELVCSEAMFHLGVPTTRALSLVSTGQPVMRDLLYDGHPAHEPGAVVCRVAPSFLRFGSYEIHASRDDKATLKKLVDFTLEKFFPGMTVAEMFAEVAHRTAWLLAEWMRVGFVHGVMNTDNMSILGLTIDYGPYGWLEPFDLAWTPNITDASQRRYRFGNQPAMANWNLAQLGKALATVADDIEPLRRTIDRFSREFSQLYRGGMLRKLGLAGRGDTIVEDDALLAQLAELLQLIEIDYTLFFRRLAEPERLAEACYDEVTPVERAQLDRFVATWKQRAAIEKADVAARIREVNPIYVPRNYLVQEVIQATERGDRTELLALIDVLRHPYDERPGLERYAQKRPEWARSKPGCSMLSCSS